MRLSLQLTNRVELLQTAFDDVVGTTLEEVRRRNDYDVRYQPAFESDGIARLNLHVRHHRNNASFAADIESTRSGFVLRSGNHTSHMSEELLPQALAVVKHGIISLRPTP